MKNLIKNISLFILFFLIIAGILTLYSAPKVKPADVSLTVLVAQINQGQVKQIAVDGDELKIQLEDGKTENSVKEAEASLTDSLKNYGVDPEKLDAVDIEIKSTSATNFWLGTFLPFVLPFIFIGAFIWFMLRQAQ